MGRFEPTREERAAGTALLKKLEGINGEITDVEFSDRPDLKFRINGLPIGCEIVGLMPGDIQQAMRTFSRTMYKRGVRVAKIVIPIEPDMWAQQAIERKWAKVQKYKIDEYSTNLSLLIHHPMLAPIDPVEYDAPGFVRGIQYGQAISTHGFRNVFYWSGKNTYSLDRKKEDALPIVYPDLSDGYPAYIQWIISAGSEGLKTHFDGVHIPLVLPVEHTMIIKPLSLRFKNLKPQEPKGDLRFGLGF